MPKVAALLGVTVSELLKEEALAAPAPLPQDRRLACIAAILRVPDAHLGRALIAIESIINSAAQTASDEPKSGSSG